MGAWGFGVFDNDSSCDFVIELHEQKNIPEKIKSIFSQTINEEDFIDLDTAAAVWVSACIIDQVLNNICYDCPDIEYDDIIEQADRAELIKLKSQAVKALDCILSDKSELNELISECDEQDYNNWKDGIMSVRNRINI